MRVDAGCAVAVLALTVPAIGAGAQTVYGPTGLFVHPTAFARPRASVGLNLSYLTQRKGGDRTEYIRGAVAYSPTDQLEVGGLYVRHRGSMTHPHDHGGVFAKYQIVPDSPHRPAIGIAASYLNNDLLKYTLSGVASHNFDHNGRTVLVGHVGVKWGKTPDMPTSRDDVAGFGGIEVPLIDRLRFVAEGATRFCFERNSAYAAGLMYTAKNGINLGIGYVNIGRSDEPRFFIGIGYPIGGVR